MHLRTEKIPFLTNYTNISLEKKLFKPYLTDCYLSNRQIGPVMALLRYPLTADFHEKGNDPPYTPNQIIHCEPSLINFKKQTKNQVFYPTKTPR